MCRSPKTLLNPPVNGKIQGLFKAFECFSSTFQGKFNFQGLFKTVLYIQVLFKPVRTLLQYAKKVSLQSRFQNIIGDGILLNWTGPCAMNHPMFAVLNLTEHSIPKLFTALK